MRQGDDAPDAPPELTRLAPLPDQVARALQLGGSPADWAFDRFLPEPLRSLSNQHWTPVAVAARAARWFDECGVRTVLDVGSGAGKFCIVAALAGHCHYTGIEHRPHLVAAARNLARTFGVERRAHFLEGALGDPRTPTVDAYYLYNPFEENVSSYPGRIDEGVELNHARYHRDLAVMCSLLERAPAGTYVLTYNGFGGTLPANYREVRTDRELPNVLCLSKKVPPRASGGARRRGSSPTAAVDERVASAPIGATRPQAATRRGCRP